MYSKRVSDWRLDVSTNSEQKWNIYVSKSKSGCGRPETNQIWKIEVIAIALRLVKHVAFFFCSPGIPWPGSIACWSAVTDFMIQSNPTLTLFIKANQIKGKWKTVRYSKDSLYPSFDTAEFDCSLQKLVYQILTLVCQRFFAITF